MTQQETIYAPIWKSLTIPPTTEYSPRWKPLDNIRKIVEDSFQKILDSLDYPTLVTMLPRVFPTGNSYTESESQTKEQLVAIILNEVLYLWQQSREHPAVAEADQRNRSAATKRLVFSDGMFLHGLALRHLRTKADGLFCGELYQGNQTNGIIKGRVFVSSLQTQKDLSQLTPEEILVHYNFAKFSNPDRGKITLILTDQSSRIVAPIPGLPTTRYVALGFAIEIGMAATDISGVIATTEQLKNTLQALEAFSFYIPVYDFFSGEILNPI